MRRFALLLFILILASFLTGCSRASRVANDIDWVVFDGEPAKDN